MRFLMLVALLLPMLADAWEEPTEIAPAGTWEDLGTAVKLSRVYSQAVGKNTAGDEVYYLGMTDAERAFVVALDPLTGESLQFNLDGYLGQVWSVCAHSNGKAYATTGSGGIFELDAATGDQRFIGNPPEGEIVVWELFEGADGNLYGGTYPSCKLARVNLETGEVEDLGRMDPEQMYVRTIAVEGEWVYCGCGVTAPAVWAYNTRTGEKTQLLPDEARQGAGWGRAMTRMDGRVYVYGNGGKFWRMTGLEMEPVDEVPHMPYFELADGTRLYAYTEYIEKNQYLVVRPDGEQLMVDFEYNCSGTKLWDVFPGPDGRIYGNTHTPITLFAYDPATGENEVLGNPVGHAGQVYASTWIDGKLHMAAYSDCTYTVWDPALEWNFGEEETSNPRRIGKTSRELQRAGDLILAPDGKHTIVAGQPGYGKSGGAIVIVDPDAAEFDVVKQPFLPQSAWTLSTTPDDDIIAVGTSLYGGSGAPKVITPGRLILWNWRTREAIEEFTPWENEYVINSLVRIGDKLWFSGAPGGKIGVFDFASGEIVHLMDPGYGRGKLHLRSEDGCLYSSAQGGVFRINPATRECGLLGTYPGLHADIALAGEYLYGFTETHLVRMKLE